MGSIPIRKTGLLWGLGVGVWGVGWGACWTSGWVTRPLFPWGWWLLSPPPSGGRIPEFGTGCDTHRGHSNRILLDTDAGPLFISRSEYLSSSRFRVNVIMMRLAVLFVFVVLLFFLGDFVCSSCQQTSSP
jgi:hypothetical protein